MAKNPKTNAARLLEKAGIDFELIPYTVDENNLAATHIADELGEDIRQVFKTLVLHGERVGYFVCVVPGDSEVDLKKAAMAAKAKKADLIPMKELLPLTGYIRGGCSPVGMKKPFPTFFHSTAAEFDTIFVSAGVRGLQLKINPSELIKYVGAELFDLVKSVNSFGIIYRLTDFGESHGSAIGGVIDGMPAGVEIDVEEIQRALARRRPGQSELTTARLEEDKVKILSGLFEGRTLGTPIGFVIANTDHHSSDYKDLRDIYRPSHADYTYMTKYGIRDYRGGGRASARETACRVVAGAFASQVLSKLGVKIFAYTSAVGDITLTKTYTDINLAEIDANAVRCPDETTARRMEELIRGVRADGDTVGGVVTCVIKGLSAGVGEPVGAKLHAMLASAMLSINAAKGFDYGIGFEGAKRRGSEVADNFYVDSETGDVKTSTNYSGGIQGGISNGEDIYFRVAFKPVATLQQPVETVNVKGDSVTLQAKGRHDPCVVPRAVPIVEAMAAMTILDAVLLNRCSRLL